MGDDIKIKGGIGKRNAHCFTSLKFGCLTGGEGPKTFEELLAAKLPGFSGQPIFSLFYAL